MRKTLKVFLVLTLIALLASVPALAQPQSNQGTKVSHGGIKFGEDGTWGFTYILEHDEDGFVDEGDFIPFFKKNKDGPFNLVVTGPYIKDGQDVDTIIGSRLGVNYSPYVAKFRGDNRILGIRVTPINVELGPVSLTLDGAYTFALIDREKEKHSGGNVLKPKTNDILLGAKADIADYVDLNLAVVRYEVANEAGAETPYTFYYNFAVEASTDIVPGLDLNGVYARYGQDEDWLYEVTAQYEAIPEALWLRAGHRNSEFKDGVNKVSVRGVSTDDKIAYVGDKKPLEKIYNRDSSINVGATYKFSYDVLNATLTADYDTTNPDVRGDLDDQIAISLNANALEFELYQKLSVLVPDEETVNDNRVINDDTAMRLDYELDFRTPQYTLPVEFADVFAQARVNFDWDQNYIADNRYQTIASVHLGATADVWRLEGLHVGAIFAYDMPSDKDIIADPFKFALLGSYDAPNGIKFRVEYQNSEDYKDKTEFVHQKPLNDRYDEIRHYKDSKFHGVRVTVGFPL